MEIEKMSLEEKSLADLIEEMIFAALEYNNSLNALDGKGSPYASEQQLRQGFLEKYQSKVGPLKEELNKRLQGMLH